MTQTADSATGQATQGSTINLVDPNADLKDVDQVAFEIVMSKDDYALFIEGARVAGLPPQEFLVQAIAEGKFIAENRRKGSRIFVQSRHGALRELVS